jgi:Flp pilus assembly protein TadD
MKRRFALACFMAVFLFSFARAQAQDDQYIRIYSLIQEGDSLKSSQPAAAFAKYGDAQKRLQQFQKSYPDWNGNVVKYRLNYLAANLAEMSASNPALTLPVAAAKTNALLPLKGQASPDTENQLGALQSQIRQLQTDNNLLESKLKEALRIQPAMADPRTVARAEQEIKALQKENELLKVNLAQRPTKTAPAPDAKALDQWKRQAADATHKAAEQSDRANTLALEKAALEKKLASVPPGNWSATNFEETQKSLEETNLRLAKQMGLTDQLSLEKSALQMRVKKLMTENEAAAALRTENEVLKRQVAEFKANPQNGSRELIEARAQLAMLQSDREMLRQEKAALEKQVKQFAPGNSVGSVTTTVVAVSDSAKVKQLEREREELQKKLEATQKQLYGRQAKGAAARVDELSGQVEVLRTRLAVVEAQRVPYTAEELALFDKMSVQIADPKAGKRSSRDLPPGSLALVKEAQKDFSARRFAQAEAKYQQVLKQDDKNVYTLANLSAIQLELNHLDDAETNITHALALEPDDPYSLSLLGFLKYRQNQFDAALDALGRAAKVDPGNAEIQNYLGLTLSQKGMRNAAESALRKAVTLDPNYAGAHYNLAVIYVTQKPPQTTLAQLHYKKALAGGMAPNPEMEKLLNPTRLTEVVP